MNAVERWWRESDHFDWLTLYLNTRGIRLIWRAMVAAVIASIAVVPTLVLLSPSLSHYPAAVVVVAFIVTAILLIFVVPQFEELFQGFGASLPAFTQFVVDLSRSMKSNGFPIADTVAVQTYSAQAPADSSFNLAVLC